MARIRTIKPEFPQSETVGNLSRDARLLFIQLWTIVDDEGRARAASRMLASLLYPYDDDAPSLMDGWLAELQRAGCIRRYVVEGSQYLDLPTWLKHQKIDKPSRSKLPSFEDGSDSPREGSRILAPDLGPSTMDQELETSSLRSEVGASAPETPGRPKARGSRIPENWEPDWECAKSLGVPPHRQQAVADKFRDYWRGKPGKDGVKLDWLATWRNWCRTECERNGWHPPVALTNHVARPPPAGDFIEYDSSLWHELAGDMRKIGRIMPAAIYTLNGKRGAYVERSRLSRGEEAA